MIFDLLPLATVMRVGGTAQGGTRSMIKVGRTRRRANRAC
jgi:hypothetical protein